MQDSIDNPEEIIQMLNKIAREVSEDIKLLLHCLFVDKKCYIIVDQIVLLLFFCKNGPRQCNANTIAYIEVNMPVPYASI